MNYSLQTVLWFATQILQVGVLAVLVSRGLHRRYPLFTAYILWEMATEPFLALARGRWEYTYYFGYWVTVAASTILTVAVLYELVRRVWPSLDAGRKIARAMVWIIVAAFIGHSVLSVLPWPRSWLGIDSISGLVLLADRDMRIVVCGMAAFILISRKTLGISQREFAVGIAAGFVLFSLAHIITPLAMMHSTVLHRSTLAAINSGVYILAELIWLGYALRPPRGLPGGSAGLPSSGSGPRGPTHAFMGLRRKHDVAVEGAN